jgi:acyl-CoA thioesterase
VALDEAEEAEVVAATVAELVDSINALEAGPDARGRPTFTTTSPKWWVHGRAFGGMVVAQALNAAMRTVPVGLQVHSLHGYFLRPTSPGSQTTHVVEVCATGDPSAPGR